MESKVADRIIELTRKWQEPERWRTSYELPGVELKEVRLADEYHQEAARRVHLRSVRPPSAGVEARSSRTYTCTVAILGEC